MPRTLCPIAIAALCLLNACAAPPLVNHAPPQQEDFPAMGSYKLHQDETANTASINAMRIGMDRGQVSSLIGNPHLKEGEGRFAEWNYVFNLRTPSGSGSVACQYMVRFDSNGQTVGGWWKENQCAELVRSPQLTAPALAQPKEPLQSILSSDSLFEFGKSSSSDLLPEGQRTLRAWAAEVRTKYPSGYIISVVGHTDRIGADVRNNPMSRTRAESVRTYLIAQGLDGAHITAKGLGSTQPVKICPGNYSPTVAQCLQPNRRVELTVEAVKK